MEERYFPRHSTPRLSVNNDVFRRSHGTPPSRRRLQFSSPQSALGRDRSFNRRDTAKQPSYTTVHLRYKTELCKTFEENGDCRFGKECTFAHGFAELRAVSRHPKYKTEMCETFHRNGFCLYGIRCHFVHSPDELGGLSPTEQYLIRKHQIEMLSSISQMETNTKPIINDALLTNLKQLSGARQQFGNIPFPIPTEQLLNMSLPAVANNAAMLLMNQLQVSVDPPSICDLLQQLSHTSRFGSPGSKNETLGSDAGLNHNLTEASLSESMDPSMNPLLDISGMSNSSFSESPLKGSPTNKSDFRKQGNGWRQHLNIRQDGQEASVAAMATAVAEAALPTLE